MTSGTPTRSTRAKFVDPDVTATGERRARVPYVGLTTLWINTGTLCNLACANCYIESSPRNDALVYISAAEVTRYLNEFDRLGTGREIGFTGGEPFMNPDFPQMLDDALERGYRVLVLTNAMKPMLRRRRELAALRRRHGERLVIRVSVDHHTRALHEEERGPGSWEPMIEGLSWLASEGFALDAAGRTRWGEDEAELRAGYARLFASLDVSIDAHDPATLILFPEMDEAGEVPEITTACWSKLGVDPREVMCASSRMVVKRKGHDRPGVIACTLIPYDEDFELGETLAETLHAVKLNHVHCAKFCVLGGGSCSA